MLRFTTGDGRQCHSVPIVDNEICADELKYFFSNLALVSGIPRITVAPERAQINIDDSDDCGKCVSECGSKDDLHVLRVKFYAESDENASQHSTNWL